MDLIITWSLVIHRPFYCCLGTHYQAVSMKSLSCDPTPQEKEAEVTNSTLSFQTLGLDQDHSPKVTVSPIEDLL